MYIPDYENPYAIWKDVERIFSAIATDESVMPCYDQQLADGWESLLCLFSGLNVAGSTWFNSSVRTWLQRLDHARILGLFLPLFLWESELDGWATPTKFTSPQSRKFLIHQWSIRAKVQWFFPRTICSLEKRLRLLSRHEPAQTWNKNTFHQIQRDKPLIVFHTCFVNLSFIKGQVHTHWLGR